MRILGNAEQHGSGIGVYTQWRDPARHYDLMVQASTVLASSPLHAFALLLAANVARLLRLQHHFSHI